MYMSERRGLLILVVVAAWVQSCLDTTSLATTKYLVPFICPVCGNKPEGYMISSTNTFGGKDRDFFARAVGDEPVVFVPTTCPKCFYSGYAVDFGSVAGDSKPEVEISEAVKEQVLCEKALKPMVEIAEGAKSYEIPAYVRYDLIAQTFQLRGKADEFVAWQFLKASWAIRAESRLPATLLGEELLREITEWKTSHWDREEATMVKTSDWALCEIAKARQHWAAAKSLEGEPRVVAALAAIGTLRSHGENAEARKVLPILKTAMPAGQYEEFEQFLNESIKLEQHFQSKAVSLFEKVADTKEDGTERACLTYLCGELYRRLESWEEADVCYRKCLEVEGRPDWLEDWVSEQRNLLPN